MLHCLIGLCAFDWFVCVVACTSSTRGVLMSMHTYPMFLHILAVSLLQIGGDLLLELQHLFTSPGSSPHALRAAMMGASRWTLPVPLEQAGSGCITSSSLLTLLSISTFNFSSTLHLGCGLCTSTLHLSISPIRSCGEDSGPSCASVQFSLPWLGGSCRHNAA